MIIITTRTFRIRLDDTVCTECVAASGYECANNYDVRKREKWFLASLPLAARRRRGNACPFSFGRQDTRGYYYTRARARAVVSTRVLKIKWKKRTNESPSRSAAVKKYLQVYVVEYSRNRVKLITENWNATRVMLLFVSWTTRVVVEPPTALTKKKRKDGKCCYNFMAD